MSAPVLDGPVTTGAPADPTLALLQQLGGDDPRLRMIAQLMEARAQVRSLGAPSDDAELALRLRRLREAYEELRAQYLRVAAALGACARCWGDDPRCSACGGAGTSGFFAPDPALFDYYVAPAVRRAHDAPRESAHRPPQSHVEG